MAQAQAGSNFLALPDDLRERLLALIPHDSLTAAALVCRAFHAVISGPQFPALRQRFGGFAAPGPLIVAVTSDYRERPLEISVANQSKLVIPEYVGPCASTTDGARLIFSACAQQTITYPVTDDPGKIWRELLMSNSFSLSVSWRLFLTRAGSWSSYRTAQHSSEPRTAPGPATKSPREPFPTTGMTACTPRPSPSARDMQVSLSHYGLGFSDPQFSLHFSHQHILDMLYYALSI